MTHKRIFQYDKNDQIKTGRNEISHEKTNSDFFPSPPTPNLLPFDLEKKLIRNYSRGEKINNQLCNQ